MNGVAATTGRRGEGPFPSAAGAGAVELDRYDLALLSGGSDLAVTVALVALDLEGAIDCGERVVYELAGTGSFTLTSLRTKKPPGVNPDFVVRLVHPLAAGAHPIEQAVYDAVATTPATAGNLVTIRIVAVAAPAVSRVRERLVEQGLSPGEEHSALVTRRAWWARGVLVAVTLGLCVVIVRSAHSEAAFRVIALFAFVALAFSRHLAALTARRAPGQDHLRAARSSHPAPKLDRQDPPLARVPELCLLVALHGERVLWSFDPALALALQLSHPTDRLGDFPWLFDGDGCDGCGCD